MRDFWKFLFAGLLMAVLPPLGFIVGIALMSGKTGEVSPGHDDCIPGPDVPRREEEAPERASRRDWSKIGAYDDN